MDSLNTGISIKTSLTKLTTNTTLLNATKRNAPITIIARVDPDHTSLNLLSNAVSTSQVGSEKRTTKTISTVISHLNGILLSAEPSNNNERPKDLFLINAHLRRNIREHGRFHEVSLAITNALKRLSTSNK